MINDTIKNIYIDDNGNCSESSFRAIGEDYELYVPKECVKMISGFGAGMCSGNTCGAVSGCLAALGYMYSNGKAHETEGFMDMCGAFVNTCEKEMGSLNCRDLKPQYFREDGMRCYDCVCKIAGIFEKFVKEQEFIK